MLFIPGSHIRYASCEGSDSVLCTQIYAWDCVSHKQPWGKRHHITSLTDPKDIPVSPSDYQPMEIADPNKLIFP